MEKYIFTSESVTEGHPDKVCDQISDAILDSCLKEDEFSRVACECLIKNSCVIVAGEITSKASLDFKGIVRGVLKGIGYTDSEYGIDNKTCAILTNIEEQSQDIAQGVDKGSAENKLGDEQGAGDQGMMFGYACNETGEFMPLPIVLAHKLTQRLSEARKNNELSYLRPDGKSQVSVEYENEKPKRVESVLVSTQHDEGVNYEEMRKEITDKIIKVVCRDWIDEETKYYINPTGSFVKGGPYADAGLTGRKIIVDTYGGFGRHGGGAFSGKDPSKVDRSAAYMARHIAKNIVASEIAEKCEVELAYAIGMAEPVSVHVDCFGTNKIPEEKILDLIKENFLLKPEEILRELDLRKPIYKKTASYGHFGREGFSWEKLDKVDVLKQQAGV